MVSEQTSQSGLRMYVRTYVCIYVALWCVGEVKVATAEDTSSVPFGCHCSRLSGVFLAVNGISSRLYILYTPVDELWRGCCVTLLK